MPIPISKFGAGVALHDCVAVPTKNNPYVQGMLDGLVFANFKVEGGPVPTTISVDRIVQAVDQFCTDDRNQHVPVVFALKLISMELSGKSKNDLAYELERLRERFRNR